MRCDRCQAELDVSGMFPGAKVACACGAESTFTLSPSVGAAYRAPAAPTPSAASEPSEGSWDDEGPCPRCESRLDESSHWGEPVNVCATCTGIFVDHASLARLVEAARARGQTAASLTVPRPKLESPVRYLPCPVCSETMNRMSFGRRSGVVVDVCKHHGTWFDSGELERVLDLAASGWLDAQPDAASRQQKADTQMAKQATAVLALERMKDEREITAATELMEDLLFVLSPGALLWSWQRPRPR